MTLPTLISQVLKRLFKDFYGPERVREFKRDERPLIKAITRYGYECNERGWFFNLDAIYREILGVLNRIKKAAMEIEYLPAYLESAITKHICMRAEELSAKAKAIHTQVSKIVNDAKKGIVTAVREPSGAELMAKVHEFQREAMRKRQQEKSTMTHQSKMQLRFGI